MPGRIQGEGSFHLNAVRYCSRRSAILAICSATCREDNGFPPVLWQIFRELQRAMHSAPAAPRRIVKCHHQHFFHPFSRIDLSLFNQRCGDVFHIFLSSAAW